MFRLRRLFLFTAFSFVAACSGAGNPDGAASDSAAVGASDLDAEILRQLPAAHAPGLSACIVQGGGVAWCKAYGLADVASERPVAADTAFLLASISKTFTATALMQVWETGAFSLDDDVAPAAGFPVAQPQFGAAITYRMLLTHTGSVRDDWNTMEKLYTEDADPTPRLSSAVYGYFDPHGPYYDASKNFVPASPGTKFEYSNMGYALTGYLVSRWTRTDFARWTREHIVEPLGLSHTSWRLDDFAPGEIATPHGWDGARYESYGQYTFADYPDGGLRATAPDLARFLAAIARGGELEGRRILRADTVASMLAVQSPAVAKRQGLAFYHREIDGEDWVGHAGSERGAATEMFFRPADGLGFVLLMNGDWSDDRRPLEAIERAVIRYGRGLAPHGT